MTELQTAGKHVSCWCGEVAYLENMKQTVTNENNIQKKETDSLLK